MYDHVIGIERARRGRGGMAEDSGPPSGFGAYQKGRITDLLHAGIVEFMLRQPIDVRTTYHHQKNKRNPRENFVKYNTV